MNSRAARLSEIAKLVDADFIGEDVVIQGLGLCNRSSIYNSVLSYVSSVGFIEKARNNPAVQALIITPDLYKTLIGERFSYILSSFPEELFYQIHHVLLEQTDFYRLSDNSVQVGRGCDIHPSVVIEGPVVVGDGVSIGPYTVVKSNTVIGDYSVIGCHCVIGCEGFQVLRDHRKMPYKVKHAGGTVIGRGVHIGDQVTVANALFEGAVTIGDHCMIDNFCYIAHNCVVGRNCILTAGVRLMGSSSLEDSVYVAPQAVVLNKVVVHEEALVGTVAMVNKDVPAGRTVIGCPAELKEDYTALRERLKSLLL